MTRRLLTIALAACCAVPAMAQGRGPGGGGGGGGMMGNRVNFLAGYLGLSDTQKADAQKIFDAAKTSAETLRGQLTTAQDALRAGVKASKSDPELDALAASVGLVEGQVAAVEAKAMVKFRAILTPDQLAKLDQMGGGRGMGMGMGPGPAGFGGRGTPRQ